MHDLLPTKARVQPKDEAHMTEPEKKRRLQSRKSELAQEDKPLDGPQVSKMVGRPRAKK